MGEGGGGAGCLILTSRAGVEKRTRGERLLNDAVFGQVAELHVAEGFPRAHHRDVRAKTLHAGDVVAEAANEGHNRHLVFGGGSRLLRCVSKKQITELDVQTTRHLTEAARNVSMLALLFIHCIFLLVCFCCLPLLAWFGRLALERASLPLLEFGWALLGCSGAGGSTRGQGASCRWAGVHCSLKTTTKNPKHFLITTSFCGFSLSA